MSSELSPPDDWPYPVDQFLTALELEDRGASDDEVREAIQEVEN